MVNQKFLKKKPGLVMKSLAGIGEAIVKYPERRKKQLAYLNSPEYLKKLKMQNKILLERAKIQKQREKIQKLQEGKNKQLREAASGFMGFG